MIIFFNLDSADFFSTLGSNNRRKYLNISGAIEINSQDVITRSSDRVDANSICILLKAIRDKNPLEKNIIFIMDIHQI